MEQENRSYTATEEVTPEKTAKAVGSGELEVYATPAMLALMEKAATACLAPLLKEGETSVGAQIGSTHLSPSPLGATVQATATLLSFDGRTACFAVTAEDDFGKIGEGEHTRAVVGAQRFLQRMREKKPL